MLGDGEMDAYRPLLFLLVSIVLAVAIVGGVTHGTPRETTSDTYLADAIETQSQLDYEVVYSQRTDGTSEPGMTLQISNTEQRAYADWANGGDTYHNPIVVWYQTDDGWEVESTDRRNVDFFSEVETEGGYEIVDRADGIALLAITDPVVETELFARGPGGARSPERTGTAKVHIDTDRDVPVELTRPILYENGSVRYVEEYRFENHGEVTVERPDDLPFSIREKVRWLLYWIGLI